MNDHRINILGASGCGATTTGRAVAAALSAAHFDSDDYFHAPSDPPFQKPRPALERHAMIVRDLGARPSWVLSGGVAGWTPYPALDFTLVVLLWTPTIERIARLRRREAERFGARIAPGGDMHEIHEAFVAWASRYDAGDVEGKTLARHEAYLAAQTCAVLDLREAMTVAERTETILHALDRA